MYIGCCCELIIAFKHARCNLCLQRVNSTVKGSGDPKQTGQESAPALSTTLTYCEMTSGAEDITPVTKRWKLIIFRYSHVGMKRKEGFLTNNRVFESVVASYAAIE